MLHAAVRLLNHGPVPAKLFGPLGNRSQGLSGTGENVLRFRTCSACPSLTSTFSAGCAQIMHKCVRARTGSTREREQQRRQNETASYEVAGSRRGGSLSLCWEVEEPGKGRVILEGSKEEGTTSRTENTKRPNAKYRARLSVPGQKNGSP